VKAAYAVIAGSSCPIGFDVAEQDCQAAAKALGKTWAVPQQHPDFKTGCILGNGGWANRVTYNTGSGLRGDYVCKVTQASTPTTPPPTPPPVTTVTTVTTVTIAESKKANGVACEASADCTSGVCTSKKCVAVAVAAAAKKVSGDLKIKMPAANATNFKTDPKVKIALQDAIAGQIPGVEKQMVEILEIMEVPTRRLSASDRLLSEAGSTTLKVMYEITLPKDMIVSKVTTAMTGEAAKTSLATLVNKELKKQNISATISVEETTAVESAPTTTLAPVSTSFAQLSNGLSNMLMSMIGVHLGFALRDVHM